MICKMKNSLLSVLMYNIFINVSCSIHHEKIVAIEIYTCNNTVLNKIFLI